jgi:hypothetical protein
MRVKLIEFCEKLSCEWCGKTEDLYLDKEENECYCFDCAKSLEVEVDD